MEKWDRENYLLDMPDVSSGASHIAPGETTKRGREVHWIIILSPLPRHTNFQCCCCYCRKCLQHIKYLGENTLSSRRKWKVVSVDPPGVNLNNCSISRKHPYFTNEWVLYQEKSSVMCQSETLCFVQWWERLNVSLKLSFSFRTKLDSSLLTCGLHVWTRVQPHECLWGETIEKRAVNVKCSLKFNLWFFVRH